MTCTYPTTDVARTRSRSPIAHFPTRTSQKKASLADTIQFPDFEQANGHLSTLESQFNSDLVDLTCLGNDMNTCLGNDMNFLEFMDGTILESKGDDCLHVDSFSPPSLDLMKQHKELSLVECLDAEWDSFSIARAIRDRLQYSLDQAKLAPKLIVETLETPWCHATLYRDNMPRSMQGNVLKQFTIRCMHRLTQTSDALASCGLYQAKNQRNAAVILRTIRDRAQDLIVSPAPAQPLEMLARAQSILLYAIMLVFSGDMISLSAAEAATPALELAALALVPHMGTEAECAPSDSRLRLQSDEPSMKRSLPLYPIGPAQEFWRNWVLQETMRRTYLMTFFVTQLYWMLRGELPKKCEPKLYAYHFWTVSAHLWRAQDAFEFALAWRDHRHFVVNNSK